MTPYKIFVEWAYCLNYQVTGRFCAGNHLCLHCFHVLENLINRAPGARV